jgi:serine/threonine protein kinase
MSCSSKSEHSRFIDNYKSINYLAEGSSCKIYVARHKLTGSQHAVKYVMKSVNKLNLNEDKILNEIKIMDGLKHENIVNFKYAWVENHHEEWLAEQEDSYFNMIESNTVYSGDKSPYLFIAMEYCGKGSLDTWLKNNPETPENTLIEMMQQVVCGLAYLHSKNIIHRDIKV